MTPVPIQPIRIEFVSFIPVGVPHGSRAVGCSAAARSGQRRASASDDACYDVDTWPLTDSVVLEAKGTTAMTNDPNDPVLLAVLNNELEASLLAAALEDHGIEARTEGDMTAIDHPESPRGVGVLVHRSEFAKAIGALEQIREENENIDWSKVDYGKPEGESES
jgi:hypothetical protein